MAGPDERGRAEGEGEFAVRASRLVRENVKERQVWLRKEGEKRLLADSQKRDMRSRGQLEGKIGKVLKEAADGVDGLAVFPKYVTDHCGRVVERPPSNRKVVGSNPGQVKPKTLKSVLW